ncbi:MAG: phosphoglycerate kinase [Coriobacteriales bacterium]|jgi:phosphoglycerate kinase|nr:phosphoglycerate kinase [Coriobacteriales bacterium]
MRTIDDVDVAGKKILLRADFNVPLDRGTVTDDTRIRAALPTIRYLLDNKARVILISHLGRPAGTGFEPEASLVPVARVLGRLLGQEVPVAPLSTEEDSDCPHDRVLSTEASTTVTIGLCGPKARSMAAQLQDGAIMMLENLRFDKREKQNSCEFAAELANLADIYVNDAFGAAHRAHASVEAIAHLMPAYAGLLLAKEIAFLDSIMRDPRRPFVAVLGGSKVSDKIKTIASLLNVVDSLIIGGGMCFTFLAAKGYDVGKSVVQKDWIGPAGELLALAQTKGVRLLLPLDLVVAPFLSADVQTSVVATSDMKADMTGLDIGPASAELFSREIAKAATVFWNGPMGVFELVPFENGTRVIATAIARNQDAVTVVGGGDSVAAAKKFALEDHFSFVSTGGGASLRLIEGNPLAALVALQQAADSRSE